jgi:GNAT superfamily N-acetyltransferase
MSAHVTVHAARPVDWPDVQQLFDRGGQVKGCWCMWFRQTAATFRANWGRGNREALRDLVADGREPGLIAYLDGRPIGWCSVAPRADYPRLASSVIAKPVDDTPVWCLTCLYVIPGERGAGVTRKLVRAACAHVARHGGTTAEAYPVDDTLGPVAADDAYHGVVSLLRSEGFTEVARPTPKRPVLRRGVPEER